MKKAPGPFEPLFDSRPSLKITARSYWATTVVVCQGGGCRVSIFCQKTFWDSNSEQFAAYLSSRKPSRTGTCKDRESKRIRRGSMTSTVSENLRRLKGIINLIIKTLDEFRSTERIPSIENWEIGLLTATRNGVLTTLFLHSPERWKKIPKRAKNARKLTRELKLPATKVTRRTREENDLRESRCKRQLRIGSKLWA